MILNDQSPFFMCILSCANAFPIFDGYWTYYFDRILFVYRTDNLSYLLIETIFHQPIFHREWMITGNFTCILHMFVFSMQVNLYCCELDETTDKNVTIVFGIFRIICLLLFINRMVGFYSCRISFSLLFVLSISVSALFVIWIGGVRCLNCTRQWFKLTE